MAAATGSLGLSGCQTQSASREVVHSRADQAHSWLDNMRVALRHDSSQPAGTHFEQQLWRVVRDGYPQSPIYCNPGSFGLQSLAVTARVEAAILEQAANPQSFNGKGEAFLKEILRPRLARIFGLSEASEIWVGVNATQGNQAVALAVLLAKSGEVVRCSTEHATTTAIPIWMKGTGAPQNESLSCLEEQPSPPKRS